MWKPLNITLKNFRSFVDQSYDFKTGAFLIQGVNKTDDGASSNGSGKSSLREALCYCLSLPTFTDTNTDLINDNADSCSVSVTLKNEKLNKELYIERVTPRKGSSSLIIKLNGEDQSDKFATVLDGNKYIIEMLGISKEDLINHFIISKEKFVSFFNSSDTKVKELIGRFSNFNRIDGVELIVQKDIDVINQELQSVKSEYDKLNGKLEVLNEQLEIEKQKDPEQLRTDIINDLFRQIEEHTTDINYEQDNIKSSNENISKLKIIVSKEEAVLKVLEEELANIDTLSFDEEIKALESKKKAIMNDRSSENGELSELSSGLNSFVKFKREVENSITGSIKCPECLHEFIPGEDIDIEEAKTKTLPMVLKEIESINISMESHKKKLEKLDESIAGINKEFDSYQKKVDEFNNHKFLLQKKIMNQISVVNDINTSISKHEHAIIKFNQNITNLNNLIDESNKLVEAARRKSPTTNEKEIEAKIKEASEEKERKEKSLHDCRNNLQDTEQWNFRFKKFRSYLANESLEIIQGYTNMYLQKMKTNLSIKLEGYKVNKDGSIREKITPVILRNGEQEGSGNYRKFSGGERSKIEFATIIALQTLINNSCTTGGLDLIWVDEITESIDGTGLELLVESVSTLNKVCLVTSHVTHEKNHDNMLTIEKVNGISKIV